MAVIVFLVAILAIIIYFPAFTIFPQFAGIPDCSEAMVVIYQGAQERE